MSNSILRFTGSCRAVRAIATAVAGPASKLSSPFDRGLDFPMLERAVGDNEGATLVDECASVAGEHHPGKRVSGQGRFAEAFATAGVSKFKGAGGNIGLRPLCYLLASLFERRTGNAKCRTEIFRTPGSFI
jgi:hypothetical protein